ncbi:hypothetical protein EDD30_1253 [Couchioplanes caeruleus]|uniref:Uncharacterized protein n=1 Tax=Couchioplanes caeruleus TaxID=56438 RepID=A0A3N1GDX9_9ACTN|nr:hypothetical protein EDD30_1253 [Couchioplanes caeruleus]
MGPSRFLSAHVGAALLGNLLHVVDAGNGRLEWAELLLSHLRG